MTLLVANRGEIALRILRTATELGLDTVAVYAADDADSPHVRVATDAIPLQGTGPAAYLDQDAILAAATRFDAELIHPGYGFLSENANFAQACAEHGRLFVGPASAVLQTFGNKSTARAAALAVGVPVLPATTGPSSVAEIREFFATQPNGVMIKALAGGGGRGMRPVHSDGDIEAAYRLCAAEAQGGFGDDGLFAEALLGDARHIEVQVVAAVDGNRSRALALGDRDCSIQRRHQKLIEIAPAQGLDAGLRRALHEAAATLCANADYRGIGTVEFLVSAGGFVFLEVNPRLQVEHTVTEEVTGVDLVAIQIAIAQGTKYADLELPGGISARANIGTHGEPAQAQGIAIQARVNMETMDAQGQAVPVAGALTAFSPPVGPGIRVDTYGRTGLVTSSRYDSLLAKVIVHVRGQSFAAALRKAETALAEFLIEGVPTNTAFLRAVLSDEGFGAGPVGTTFLAEHMPQLLARVPSPQPQRQVSLVELRGDEEAISAQLAGTVVELPAEGVELAEGAQLAVLEAMKMQHVLVAPSSIRVLHRVVSVGDTVNAGEPLVVVTRTGASNDSTVDASVDLDHQRRDEAEIRGRHEITLDASRPTAIAKRHKLGRRSARENIADLVDPGSFVEYGALVLAAQRSRRSEQDLIENTPADGMVAGLATVNAEQFGMRAAEAVVLSYDYSVLAGTQGMRNHAKTDRLFELAARRAVPLVLFAEGGGGRPGDTDAGGGAGLELGTFRALGALAGKVPTVSIVSGRCFAGNAALAGICDVLIATPEANIGMGGPAMIEGGGLGRYRPEEIGPIEVQRRNGVVDLLARDEEHAVALAKQYLAYFQGSLAEWAAPDARLARHVVPENRLRAYDVHAAIDSLADLGSVLELRSAYGVGIVTALIRVEGVSYGLIANSSHHLGGAIDAEAADKMADFLTLCESFGLPLVSLCDTPGFMVGPNAEAEATVRRFSALFIVGARLTVPFGTIILRKGYGLGAMAMAGGSFRAPQFTVAWPTGEIGGMGLEGAVRLGFSKELAALDDPAEREKLFAEFLALAYQHGKALTAATTFELDDVIDPADSRAWIRQLAR